MSNKGIKINGITWYKEVEKFLKDNAHKEYSLSIFDKLGGASCEILCKPEEFLDVLNYVVHLEHDFPEWIGANDVSASYVVGMSFTRGHLKTPAIYKWENSKLIDKTQEICTQEGISNDSFETIFALNNIITDMVCDFSIL